MDEGGSLGLKVLCALAWADGEVAAGEMAHVAEFITLLGDLDAETVQQELKSTKTLPDGLLERLATAPLPDVGMLLASGYAMVNAERPATSSEMEVLRRVACARLGQDQWDKIVEWLAAQRRAEDLWDQLFQPELPDEDVSEE